MSWTEPVFTPFTHFMVVVPGPPESDFTLVLVRIWMLPLVQFGAVFCLQSIDKITLLQQLRLLRLCGHELDSMDGLAASNSSQTKVVARTGGRFCPLGILFPLHT